MLLGLMPFPPALVTGALLSLSLASADVPEALIAPGVRMPMLALGTAPASEASECPVQEAVQQWLRLGGRHIDTANDYGTQKEVGAALKAAGVAREELFVTTKVEPRGKQAALDLILNHSLPELGIDYLDLVLIHEPCFDFDLVLADRCGDMNKAERIDTWEGLVELAHMGVVRAVGVSNYDDMQIAELRGSALQPAVNQVQWHLGYHNETLLHFMKAANVTVSAWGALDGKTPAEHHSPGVSLSDERLKPLAAKYNISTAQLALRWSVEKGVAPVTFTCNEAHALGDLGAFSEGLAAGDVAYLDSLHPVPEPSKHKSEIVSGLVKGLLSDTDDVEPCHFDVESTRFMFMAVATDLQNGDLLGAASDLSAALASMQPAVYACQRVNNGVRRLLSGLESLTASKALANIKANQVEILKSLAEASKHEHSAEYSAMGFALGRALHGVVTQDMLVTYGAALV